MKYVINTLEISTVIGMSHGNLMRKIRGSKKDIGIIQRLVDLGKDPQDYLKATRYMDEDGNVTPCYVCTELGYNFLLNTFIGDRGAKLSAYYAEKLAQQSFGPISRRKESGHVYHNSYV